MFISCLMRFNWDSFELNNVRWHWKRQGIAWVVPIVFAISHPYRHFGLCKALLIETNHNHTQKQFISWKDFSKKKFWWIQLFQFLDELTIICVYICMSGKLENLFIWSIEERQPTVSATKRFQKYYFQPNYPHSWYFRLFSAYVWQRDVGDSIYQDQPTAGYIRHIFEPSKRCQISETIWWGLETIFLKGVQFNKYLSSYYVGGAVLSIAKWI